MSHTLSNKKTAMSLTWKNLDGIHQDDSQVYVMLNIKICFQALQASLQSPRRAQIK